MTSVVTTLICEEDVDTATLKCLSFASPFSCRGREEKVAEARILTTLFWSAFPKTAQLFFVKYNFGEFLKNVPVLDNVVQQ